MSSKPQQSFDAGGLKKDLRRRTVKAGYVTALTQATKFGLTIGGSAALARLLQPSDFGLVAMALAVTGTVDVFKDFGFTTATIQRKSITRAQVSNLFWLNALNGLGIALLTVLAAPFIAAALGDPRLRNILWATAGAGFISSMSGQHVALLAREMRFGALGSRDVMQIALNQISAIIFAWQGFGYWSLILSRILAALVGTALLWRASGFRPGLPERRSGTRSLVSFGANLTLASFLNTLTLRLDALLIGRFCGPQAAGLYNRAATLLRIPVTQVLAPLEAVFKPALSRVQDEPAQYRRVFLRAFDTIALVALPITGMCVALAEPIILTVYGAKWREAIPIFSAFALMTMYTPATACASWLLVTQGRGKDNLTKNALILFVSFVSILFGLQWGPVGAAYSYALSGLFIRLPIIFYLCGRNSPVSTRDLWQRLLTHLPSWIAVLIVSKLALSMVPGLRPVHQLLLCVPIAVATALTVGLCYKPSKESFRYLLDALRNRKTRSSPLPTPMISAA